MGDTKRAIRDFTPEFRIEAAKLVIENGTGVTQAANDLGLSSSTLQGWVTKFRSGLWDIATGLPSVQQGKPLQPVQQKTATTSPPNAQTISDKARIQELERQNRRLTLERDILKKAMAYCVDIPR